MISKRRVFLQMAEVLSQLGTCDRKRVGAVITIDGRAVSWGYNGAPPGLPHCVENAHGHTFTTNGMTDAEVVGLGEIISEEGCRNATHAEANAIAFAAKQGISTDGATLYVTVSPCDVCARLIIAAGIQAVEYTEEYRDPRGVKLLNQAGIPARYWPF